MKIYYGTEQIKIEITELCINKLKRNNKIIIPAGDRERANYFSDPVPGVVKKVFIERFGNEEEYDFFYRLIINLEDNSIEVINEIPIRREIEMKIRKLHSKLNLKYGNFSEELPEQKMAIRYLTGNEKVLEIGGNIGRNSLIIGELLGNNSVNFVSLESDSEIANQLKENRNSNAMLFNVEASALSKRKLIQRNWDTIPSDVLLDGYKWVNTIDYEGLISKYGIDFDTLVIDCEGAFYYILMDMPEILNNIKLIIMENDYYDINKKNYVNQILESNGFYVDYVESGGWGPCYGNFYEVWKKEGN
jgi:FkbM family methyltransferase